MENDRHKECKVGVRWILCLGGNAPTVREPTAHLYHRSFIVEVDPLLSVGEKSQAMVSQDEKAEVSISYTSGFAQSRTRRKPLLSPEPNLGKVLPFS